MGYEYKPEDLKVDIEVIQRKAEERRNAKEPFIEPEQEEPLSNSKAVLVVIMLLVMYIFVTALPTFLFMHFFHLSFWWSQAISFAGVVLIVWIFGLYKPASKEQKMKSKILL
jgi:Ca2+/Na+ antiporter